MRGRSRILAFTLVGLAAMTAAAEKPIQYPRTRRVEHVDDYHGTKVPDPYRWLEDDVRKSKDVAAWVEAQNKLTFSFLERIPQRQAIHRRLTRLWDYERYSAPFQVAGRYFYYRNDGLQNQSVLCTTGE